MAEGTASGKIILFGEHAVVYGRPAVAVPVSNVQAVARLLADAPGRGLTIDAPDLGRTYDLATAPADDPLALIVRSTLEHFSLVDIPDAVLRVSSTIPLGRGLGSGAAISTAIVRAMSRFFHRPLSPEEISRLVYEVEKLHHGTPSGIDNTVIAYDQPVYFIKGKPIQRMGVGRPFTVVIGDTGIVAPTHRVVGDLRRRWQEAPDRYEGYFDEIAAIARQARVVIEQARVGLDMLGRLMNDNQELLETIGVSSPELERLVAAARRAGALGAKLSGAGWGGNMIALSPPEPGAAEAIAQALRQAGAAGVIITTVR